MGLPPWDIPLIAILDVNGGNGDKRVMVLPARLLSGSAKMMESRVDVPLAEAWLIASRREPGPLSALVETTMIAGNAVSDRIRQHEIRKLRIRAFMVNKLPF